MIFRTPCIRPAFALCLPFALAGGEIASGAEPDSLVVIRDDFQATALSGWEAADPEAWRLDEREGNRFLSLFTQSRYQPPVRTPFNRILRRETVHGGFTLDIRVRSTKEDYPHRDLCIFFGYQDESHHYYVHLGRTSDPHSNSIFIVNGADRVSIADSRNEGTAWDDGWHSVRIAREAESGMIRVFWDDLIRPVMTAFDSAFLWGKIGLGSFDDTGDFDDLKVQVKNPASGNAALLAEDAEIVKICGGFSFTEGPAADKAGNVFFTDQPNNRIYQWSVKNKLSVFHDSAQRSNGLYFREDGTLLACADEQCRLISLDQKGRISVLAGEFDGKPFNGPNDLWIDPSGRIYFTDPYYQRPWWTRTAPDQDCEGVYCLEPSGRLFRVADDFKKPNGIIGTPDGKILYVADIGTWRIYRYDILPDGSLSGKKWFAPEGSDGMTLDEKGNVYLTNSAVSVYGPAGLKIASIPVPEMPSNACFGGKDRKTLFITARTSLYALKMKVRGM